LAVVVAKPGDAVSEADIKTLLTGYAERGIISKYGVPDRIVFADSLPKTSAGKLDKKAMRELYGKKECRFSKCTGAGSQTASTAAVRTSRRILNRSLSSRSK